MAPPRPRLVAEQLGRTALVAGTFDTKGAELMFVRDRLRERGMVTRTVDLSTTRHATHTDVSAADVASCHPRGGRAVFIDDRGAAVTAMSEAFEIWVTRQRDIGGMISAAGSGGTALVSPGMRALPVGVPKLIVSTVASGDVGPYVGPADITMMYSVADIQGINSVTETILANAAAALAGMIAAAPTPEQRRARRAAAKPAIGVTMFGVTTPCVQGVVRRLRGELDCLVFHATGVGGRSMEKLVDAGDIAAVMDLTTTELADRQVGGVFAADDDRMGAIIRTGVPYVGSLGALDMVNFGAMDSVPERFRARRLVVHNPNVTLMRTTVDECRAIGEFIASRLNRMTGPVRFLIPEGGFSAIDRPGQPFHDPTADAALVDTLERLFEPSPNRRLVRVPANINDEAFIEAAVSGLREIYRPTPQRRSA
ncbi:MAG: Tm-1-like ATP-binding domain-containing protein [Burkholderiaceae bacterium]